ncbi:uncharacterized protein LOC129587324 isoform X2 [Paramacrobiotus metropolitanus]|nr:uncharacterized protein LOC129587324 isoform X2 [Paramacrobiotus metropolitanus]
MDTVVTAQADQAASEPVPQSTSTDSSHADHEEATDTEQDVLQMDGYDDGSFDAPEEHHTPLPTDELAHELHTVAPPPRRVVLEDEDVAHAEDDTADYHGQSMQFTSANRSKHRFRKGQQQHAQRPSHINVVQRQPPNAAASHAPSRPAKGTPARPPPDNIRYFYTGPRQRADDPQSQLDNPYIGQHVKTSDYTKHIRSLNHAINTGQYARPPRTQAEHNMQVAEHRLLESTSSFLTSLRDNVNNLNDNKYCSFPVPMCTVLSPHYFQSWRFDKFSRSPWIKYPSDDNTWRYEHRTGFVYRYDRNNNRFVQTEQSPRYFNPYRYFPIDLPFWPSEIMWDGTYSPEGRNDALDMWHAYDDNRARKLNVPICNQVLPFVELPDVALGQHMNRDVASILDKRGIPNYSESDIYRMPQPTVRDPNQRIRELEDKLAYYESLH